MKRFLRVSLVVLAVLSGVEPGCAPAQDPEGGVITTPGAEIRFPAGRRGSAIRFLEAYPDVRNFVRRLTGAPLDETVIIELVRNSADLAQRTRALGGAEPDHFIAGLAFSARRHILIRLDADGTARHRVQGLLTHELTHVAVHEHRRVPGAAPIPRWLDEGIAQYAEGQPVTDLFWDLSVRARFGFLIPLEDLDQAFLARGSRRASAYVQAESLTRFMVRWEGRRQGVRILLRLLSEGTSLDRAVREVALVSLRELEVLWIEDLKSNVGATMKSLGPLVFAAFLAIACAVIMMRRQRRKREIEDRWAREEEDDGWNQSAAETSSR